MAKRSQKNTKDLAVNLLLAGAGGFAETGVEMGMSYIPKVNENPFIAKALIALVGATGAYFAPPNLMPAVYGYMGGLGKSIGQEMGIGDIGDDFIGDLMDDDIFQQSLGDVDSQWYEVPLGNGMKRQLG